MRKRLILLLAIAQICLICSSGAETITKLPVGTIVSLGCYEQDGDASNGAEPILWYVCEHDVEHNAICILSEKVLDTSVFNGNGSNAWKDSELSIFLNSAFMTTAFNEYEQGLIIPVMVDAENRNGTTYAAFVPTLEQWNDFPYAMKRTTVTSYSAEKDPKQSYWLMSGASTGGKDYACVADGDSNAYYQAPQSSAGIRPMLWVSLGTPEDAKETAFAINAKYQVLYEAVKNVYLPEFVHYNANRGQLLAVYAAPSEAAWRGGKGKATVSTNGEVLASCTEGEWTLIMYETNNGAYRAGYVKGLTGSGDIPAARWSGDVAVVTRKCTLTDDPVKQSASITSLSSGAKITHLATYGAFAYVETTYNKQSVRGFIPADCISVE